MTRDEQLKILGDELCLKWVHCIPIEKQGTFIKTVRWSLESASRYPEVLGDDGWYRDGQLVEPRKGA